MTRPEINQQITWVYTRDLEETARFYDQVLGLTEVFDQGTCRVYRATRDGFLGLCAITRPDRWVEPRGMIISIVTDDVDGWYEKLRSAEADLLGPPEVSEDKTIYSFYVRDPNGYRLEFQRFFDPSWPA